jgi:hypothetical protein
MDQTHHPPDPVEQEYQHERRYLVTAPVACYFALLVGVTMTPLGVLGFIPWLTPGGALFGLLRVTPAANIIHLVTGLAGLAVWQTKNGTYARAYALVIAGVYLITFSTGNIGFGNMEGTPGTRGTDIPWILENAMHASLMLAGALVGGLSALQQGDKATEMEYKRRSGKFSRRRHQPPDNHSPQPST